MFHPATELTDDPAFRRRVIRLVGVSAVALGMIFLLWSRRLETNDWVGVALAGGWLLMPTLLALSLRWPKVRYGLVVPASLVTIGLLVIVLVSRPDDRVAAAGWVLLTVGISMGATLGLWFWFRIAPVPEALDMPFAPGRWLLVAVHSALVVAGLLMVVLSAGE